MYRVLYGCFDRKYYDIQRDSILWLYSWQGPVEYVVESRIKVCIFLFEVKSIFLSIKNIEKKNKNLSIKIVKSIYL